MKIEILRKELNNNIINNNRIDKNKSIFKKYVYLYTKSFNNASYAERVFAILNNLLDRPKCKECKKEYVRYIDKGNYRDYCSQNCSSKNKNTQKLKKQTSLKRHGNETYNNTKKRNLTCLKKYGVTNVSKSKIIKQKIISTNLDKFGKEYYSQTKEHKKSNWQEKYKETVNKRTPEETARINSQFHFDFVKRYSELVPLKGKELGHLYQICIFNDNEMFFKPGITCETILKRYHKKLPKEYAYIILEDFIMTNLETAILEKQIKQKNKHLKYHPQIKFAGWTECYKVRIIL